MPLLIRFFVDGSSGTCREMISDLLTISFKVGRGGEPQDIHAEPGSAPETVAAINAEVAKAIYFLCTEQSSYVNGAELLINGGQHV